MAGHDTLINELHTLGFTHHESRCYIALMEGHPATAYEIAKRAGLPRTNAYGALDSLLRKEAVQPVSENPVRFAPVAPDKMFRRIANETASLCDSVVRSLGRIKQPQESSYVWSIPNTTQVHIKIAELIENAQQRIWIKGTNEAIEAHVEALTHAAERNVEVVIILFGDAADAERYRFGKSAKIFLHEGSGTHVGHSNHLFCIAVDRQEGLTASLRENGFGIHTHNPPVVELINNLIRHEIYLAEIFAVFGDEIESEFGKMLLSLREKYLLQDFVDDLKSRLNEEKTEPASHMAKR